MLQPVFYFHLSSACRHYFIVKSTPDIKVIKFNVIVNISNNYLLSLLSINQRVVF